MKHAHRIARIRALCSLGLPGEQLIPALLEALHGVIPSSRNLFDWTDAQGNLVRYYFEGPIDHAINRRYFEEFYNRREREAMPGFRQAVTGRAMIHRAAEVDNAAFHQSALYNEIWRPQGLHTRIEAIVRTSRGQPLGSLVLYREEGDPPFTPVDEELLAMAVPYVARALEADTMLPREYVLRRDRRAQLSLTPDGALAHLSPDAHKLLLLAHGGITPDEASRAPRAADYPTLRLLVEQLRRNEGLSRTGVALTVENVWGRFLFEAEPLLAVVEAMPPMIHVAIQQEEPRAVALRRALDALPLSVAQKEVCALLRAGCTQREIAAAMSIAPSTVADYVRKIYVKLDVHTARELSQRLEAAATGTER
jgi:DNA-binding CsgD family transcriptional regulator